LKDYGDEHYAACWLLERDEPGASKIVADIIGDIDQGMTLSSDE